MTARRLTTTAAVLMTATALAGCGIGDPYTTSAAEPSATSSTTTTTETTTTSSSTAADAQDPAPERGGTIPVHDRHALDHVSAGAGRPAARAAVTLYAELYINWRAATLATVQRHLARISIGPARQAAKEQAATVPTHTTLRADRVANHGQVVSAAPGRGAEHGRWVVVTREQTTGTGPYHGLPYELHVTLATVTHTRHGWVITQWAPQT